MAGGLRPGPRQPLALTNCGLQKGRCAAGSAPPPPCPPPPTCTHARTRAHTHRRRSSP
jgi:hypothetical protein